MSLPFPTEITLDIVERLHGQYAYGAELASKRQTFSNDRTNPYQAEKDALLNLRASSRILQTHVDKLVFNRFEISKFSKKSIRSLEACLASKSSAESIKTVSIAPQAFVERPQVKWCPGEFEDDLHIDKPTLIAMHESQVKRASQYDDQIGVIWPDYGTPKWYASRVIQYATGYQPDPLRPHLAASPYFSGLEKMKNMSRLEMTYPVSYETRNPVYVALKDEMSIGLGRFLAKNPRKLRTVAIQAATSQDIQLIVDTIKAELGARGQYQLVYLKTLELELIPEAVDFCGEKPMYDPAANTDPIHALEGLIPNLQDSNITIKE